MRLLQTMQLVIFSVSYTHLITLRTSIIVGFPGETDEQFEELCDFVKEIKFDNMGVFTYSQEDGTCLLYTSRRCLSRNDRCTFRETT